MCYTEGNQERAPPPAGNYITQKSKGSGGATPPCAQAPHCGNFITQKAREAAEQFRLVRRRGTVRRVRARAEARPGRPGCHGSGGRGPGGGRGPPGQFLLCHRHCGSGVRAGPRRRTRRRLSSAEERGGDPRGRAGVLTAPSAECPTRLDSWLSARPDTKTASVPGNSWSTLRLSAGGGRRGFASFHKKLFCKWWSGVE